MPRDPDTVQLVHITPISNLTGILKAGGLFSDAELANQTHEVIGYSHIKSRRLSEYRVSCCDNRFVGTFVPFYYCPRSPMLYTINQGNTGRPKGSQREILHLTTTVSTAIALGKPWAISDGNAGAAHTLFYRDLSRLELLDWEAIETRQWQGRTHQKSTEFLVADFFPWTAVQSIGCYDAAARMRVLELLDGQAHSPAIAVQPRWYY